MEEGRGLEREALLVEERRKWLQEVEGIDTVP